MRRFLSLVVVICALFSAGQAHAQIHWDASFEAGAMKRFRSNGPWMTQHQPLFGPTAQFAAHLALMPLVHVGGYLENDISGVQKEGWRDFTTGGLHVQGFLPVFPPNWRGWLFVGIGYGAQYQHKLDGNPSQSGGFVDLPFGIGASYRFRKPFSLFAELGGRAEFANHGFDAQRAQDRAAMDLAIGLMVEL